VEARGLMVVVKLVRSLRGCEESLEFCEALEANIDAAAP
jgi:hypothetical protein